MFSINPRPNCRRILHILMELIDDIFRKGTRCYDFNAAYDQIYFLITHGYCDKLYKSVQVHMRSYFHGKVWDRLKGAEDSAFQDLMKRTWTDFVDAARTVDELLVYLNTVMQRRDPKAEKTYDMALTAFRGFLAKDDNHLLRRLSQSVVRSMDASRLGHPCDGAHVCSQLLLAISKGDRSFFRDHVEDAYLVKVDRHLSSVGRVRSSVTDYVHVVNKVLESETQRALAYCDRQTADAAARKVLAELVVPQTRFIVESGTGLWTLIAAKRTAPVAEIYDLLMRLDDGEQLLVDAVDRLADIKYRGLPVNVNYVVQLIELEDAMRACVDHSFDGHPDVARSVAENLRRLWNRKDGTVPRFLSLHVEDLLKENRTTYAQMNNAASMLRYVDDAGRDAFEKHYRHRLAARLVRYTGPAVVEPRERVLLNRLTMHFGASRARKMRGMVNDLDGSAALMADYYERYPRRRAHFSLRTLDANNWPLAKEPSACALPGCAVSRFNAYLHFDAQYLGDRQKLVLMPQLCSAVMTGAFRGRDVEMNVSMFAAVVMLLFNTSAALSYEQISKTTGVGDVELHKALKSLTGQCLLTKSPAARTIRPNDVFQPNEHFRRRKVFC